MKTMFTAVLARGSQKALGFQILQYGKPIRKRFQVTVSWNLTSKWYLRQRNHQLQIKDDNSGYDDNVQLDYA